MMKNNRLKTLIVFAEPTRLDILLMIKVAGELRAKDILEKLTITQPTLSHHMNLLTASGILNARKEGRCVWYSIAPKKLDEISDTVLSFKDGSKAVEYEEKPQVVIKPEKSKPPKEEKHKKKDKKDKKKKKK